MAELVRPDLNAGPGACAFVAADADLPLAAARCAWAAFSSEGRAAFALRRVYVETPARDELRRRLVENVRDLERGADAASAVAPLADEAAAAAVEEGLKEAVARGARLWAGGQRRGAFLPPALLEGVPADARLARDQFAGPVAQIEVVEGRDAALEKMAAFSAAAGRAALFTNDLGLVLRAFERLKVAELIVNDASAAERDGLRSAVAARLENRTLVMRP